MLWDEFVAIPNGTRVLNNGYDQCVALANLYHEQVIGGSFVPVASAYQWSTEFSRYAQLTNNYTQLPAHANPEPGDIFVSRGGIYNSTDGHIGIVVRAWNGANFGTKEQNGELNRYVYQIYDRSKANMLSYLRPKLSPLPKPRKTKKMLQFITDNPNGAWYVTDGMTKRPLKPGENQMLVDLGLAVYSGKPGGVHVISSKQLAAIPNEEVI
jgi:hypothetical protein